MARQLRWVLGALGVFGIVALAGCGSLRDTPPTPEPIYVTATDIPPVIPLVATETPSPSPQASLTAAALLPTQDLSTRTATPSPPPPITMTPTFTPTATDTPATPGLVAVYGPVGGGVEDALAGTTACETVPQGTIGAVYQSDPNLQSTIGCPLAAAPVTVSSAIQPYERGRMIWVSSLGVVAQPTIYALLTDGTYQRFNDTFVEGVDPDSVGSVPPEGLIEPMRGFGKVWRENTTIRDRIGWAAGAESGTSAQVLPFERGEMLRLESSGQTYIFVAGAPGTWSVR